MKIIDKAGTFFINTGAFRNHDPERDCFFEPGEVTKVIGSGWLKSQTHIVECDEDGVPKPKPAATEEPSKMGRGK